MYYARNIVNKRTLYYKKQIIYVIRNNLFYLKVIKSVVNGVISNNKAYVFDTIRNNNEDKLRSQKLYDIKSNNKVNTIIRVFREYKDLKNTSLKMHMTNKTFKKILINKQNSNNSLRVLYLYKWLKKVKYIEHINIVNQSKTKLDKTNSFISVLNKALLVKNNENMKYNSNKTLILKSTLMTINNFSIFKKNLNQVERILLTNLENNIYIKKQH